jgi:hypothetical protein
MIPERTSHLSDEALDDVLIGMGAPEAEKHLAACQVCRERVEAFRSGLDEFDQTTLAWSQARSNAMERIQVRPRLQRLPRTFMGWALAVAVLLAIAIPLLRYNDHFWSNQNPTQISSSEDSETQIAQDNELLKAVNVAINEDNESLNNVDQLLGRPHPRQKTRPE